jgi:hypothetical protein
MPSDGNEPQSYGSGADWVTGETGEEVNPPKSAPSAEHHDFYHPHHEANSDEHQGGHTSEVQLAECALCQEDGTGDGNAEKQPVAKVTSKHGGAKHDSYFRKRDYE